VVGVDDEITSAEVEGSEVETSIAEEGDDGGVLDGTCVG
jgi:hypothetical protein